MRFSQPTREWFPNAITRTQIRVAPLDAGPALEGARLFRVLRDSADCQIVGARLHLNEPLATRDPRILENAEAPGLEVRV